MITLALWLVALVAIPPLALHLRRVRRECADLERRLLVRNRFGDPS
jgi:hypothetical protein